MLASELQQIIEKREHRLISVSVSLVDLTEALQKDIKNKEFPFLRIPVAFPVTVDQLIRMLDAGEPKTGAFHIIAEGASIEQRIELGRKLLASQDNCVYIRSMGFYDDVPAELWPAEWPVWGPFGYQITKIEFDNQVPPLKF